MPLTEYQSGENIGQYINNENKIIDINQNSLIEQTITNNNTITENNLNIPLNKVTTQSETQVRNSIVKNYSITDKPLPTIVRAPIVTLSPRRNPEKNYH